MNVRPLKTYIYIQEVKQDQKTASGIIIQGTVGKDNKRAKVITVGPEVEGVEAGNYIYPIWSLCNEVEKVDGKRRYIVRSEDVLGVDESGFTE